MTSNGLIASGCTFGLRQYTEHETGLHLSVISYVIATVTIYFLRFLCFFWIYIYLLNINKFTIQLVVSLIREYVICVG